MICQYKCGFGPIDPAIPSRSKILSRHEEKCLLNPKSAQPSTGDINITNNNITNNNITNHITNIHIHVPVAKFGEETVFPIINSLSYDAKLNFIEEAINLIPSSFLHLIYFNKDYPENEMFRPVKMIDNDDFSWTEKLITPEGRTVDPPQNMDILRVLMSHFIKLVKAFREDNKGLGGPLEYFVKHVQEAVSNGENLEVSQHCSVLRNFIPDYGTVIDVESMAEVVGDNIRHLTDTGRKLLSTHQICQEDSLNQRDRKNRWSNLPAPRSRRTAVQ
jgi:hypothetical protein